MHSFKSYSVNRWLTGFLCLSLLVSILASSTNFLLRRAAAQGNATLKTGSKLGTNLPDLASIRYQPAADPKAPNFPATSSMCFDCIQPSALDEAFSEARLDPSNRTGEAGVDLFSQNAHWAQPLINLQGRAGLDLKLSLVYDSLVWTKAKSQIAFDADRGQPSPGFRLSFPTIQPRFRNTQNGKSSYLLITPEGKHIELRQGADPHIYESVDNSLLQMIDNGTSGALLLRPDGTRYSLKWFAGQLQCVEVEDRNGNYITSDYDKFGHLKSIVDTLDRTFLFVRDSGGNLVSIKQKTSGTEDRVLATFAYSDLEVETTPSELKLVGPANGSKITVLTQVGIPDGSRFQFDYTSWGQVWRITKYAPDGHALNYVSYHLTSDTRTSSAGVPRVTEMRNWAEGANNESETITQFEVDPNGSSGQATLPDGSIHKEFFAVDGWQRGLAVRTEEWVTGVLQKRTTILRTQSDTSVNPRLQETDTVDSQGVHQRTRTEYDANDLPADIYHYSFDGLNVKSHTHYAYNLNPEYVKRHILGLVSEQSVFGEDGTMMSKTAYDYDLRGYLVDQGPTVQHDVSYDAGFLLGRGLLCATRQWTSKNIGNVDQAVAVFTTYNTNGSVASKRDSSGHQSTISYDDNFSGGKDRKTKAFATKTVDSAGKQTLVRYDFDTGKAVWRQDSKGRTQVFSYDSDGRRIGITNQATGATVRKVYDANGSLVATIRKLAGNLKELGTYAVYDGAGRIRAEAADPLTKAGGYSGIYITRDALGRIVSKTKRTKMSSSWIAEEPVVSSTRRPDREGNSSTAMATITNFGRNVLAGLNELNNAIEPTAHAQGCGYYDVNCGDDEAPGSVAGYDEAGNLLLWTDGSSMNVLLWVNVSINDSDNPQEAEFLSTTNDYIAQLEPLPDGEESELDQEEDEWRNGVQEVDPVPPDPPDIDVPFYPIISYRVDDRPPDEIFGPGFFSWGNNMDLWNHVSGGPNSGYVGTTLDPFYAGERAVPGQWIYVVQGMGNGVDVNQTLGAHAWDYESEIAYPNSIPPQDVIGARQVLPNGQLGPLVSNPNWIPQP